MRLQPYIRVNDTLFTASVDEILGHRGVPQHRQGHDIGLTALDYGEQVFRFQDSTGRLEEVTARAPVLYLLTDCVARDLPFASLAAFVRAQDGAAFDRVGFLVSPRFGLAFVPSEPDWVTALAAHCIDTWRAL